MLGWLESLPDDLIARRPVLSVYYAGELLDRGQLDGAEAHLLDAEQWLDTTAAARYGDGGPSAEPIVVDEAEFRRLPGRIAIYRTAQAHLHGDVDGTMRRAAAGPRTHRR